MLIYQRYVYKNILITTILLTFICTGLIWVTQILKLLYLVDKGIKITYFCELVLLILPSLLFTITPFVTVIGIIFIYNRLSQERQLIILKNFGVNNLKLARPALLFSILITLFSYYLSSTLMPYTYSKLKNGLIDIKENHISKIIFPKIFNQVSKTMIIFVKENLSNGELRGIVLFDNRNTAHPAILFARSGTIQIIDNVPTIFLKEGSRQAYDHNNNLTKLYFENLSIELNKSQIKTANPLGKDINEYYIGELLNPTKDHSSQRMIKLIAEGHQRIIWPLYSFVLTFLALSVFLSQSYNRKSQKKPIVFSTITIVTITYLHFTLQNLAARNLQFIYLSYVTILSSLIIGAYLYKKDNL